MAMTHFRIKLAVAAVVIALAVTYLAMAGVKKGWVYHMAVDAYVADNQFHNQRVRLCGKVGEENLTSNPGRLTATFVLLGDAQSVPVAYHGVIPDLFKAGCEVIIEGQMDSAGVFKADLMMTKCASKYDAAEGEGQGAPHGKHPADIQK
jgi:cytochrome c-type biogenesis protein CcmE